MKKLAVAAAAWCAFAGIAFAQDWAPTAPPPGPDGASAESLLPALIEHSRATLRLEDGRLVGRGGDLLRALGAQSQFVLIGEEHGNVAIARFIEAYWRDLSAVGFNHAAIETDPWVTRALERELRAGGVGGWAQFLQGHGGAFGSPFFNWASEAELANTIVSSGPRGRTPTLWGLDQTFIGAAGWQLRQVAETATNANARVAALQLADAFDADPLNWLGRSDAAPLAALNEQLNAPRDRDNRALIEAMLRSQAIYRPFTGAGGEANLANADRELLMKQSFLHNYRIAAAAERGLPRAMLKFGSYHMYRGASPTGVQALGGFVSEFALTTGGGGALAINVQCGPGGSVGVIFGEPPSCDEYFQENWGFLADYVDRDAVTVFDLRVWKLRLRRWEHLPFDQRRLLESFDILVVVPNGAAAQFLDGLPPPTAPQE